MTTRAIAGHRHIDVKLGRQPVRIRRLVTSCAVGVCRNMFCGHSCGIRTVVATGAIGSRGECAVVDLGAHPSCGGLVATLTIGVC